MSIFLLFSYINTNLKCTAVKKLILNQFNNVFCFKRVNSNLCLLSHKLICSIVCKCYCLHLENKWLYFSFLLQFPCSFSKKNRFLKTIELVAINVFPVDSANPTISPLITSVPSRNSYKAFKGHSKRAFPCHFLSTCSVPFKEGNELNSTITLECKHSN